ncbi:ClpP/crotonase-like domain-containing protein [Cantharellus anzutake]|uniref:ClpP/crotonase-like domain-containing protein n=1 Tax=Cantharellus anzutake TaxID=1750568 RepID=UPI001908E8D9|nr:ClpP/crotonase-like domain-containing protein [Cantharellus anzutake]KAF8323640.1 ClpP/crotonase-like domain-containing protein [Cantharellus anzutake]
MRRPLASAPTTRLIAVSRHMTTASPPGDSSSAPDRRDNTPVLFESAYSSRTFILNQPKTLNALDQGMINLISPKIKEWDNSNLCKMIISKGIGRAYCAGGEVKTIVKYAANEKTRQRALDYFKSEFQLDYDLATLQKPYISVMEGITMGGGVGLSAYARFRIATPSTLFAMPETKIGYAPDVGTTYILSRPRLDGEIGTYLALTGETIKGYEVFRLGLATHYVDSSIIPSLLERLGGLEEPHDKVINETIEEFSLDVDAEREKEMGVDQLMISTGAVRVALDLAFGVKDIEGVFDTLRKFSNGAFSGNTEDKEKVSKWAKETLEVLNMRSPTSLRVAFEAVRRASREDWRLSDSLQMELGIANAFCSGGSPDFITGVTAVLFEKSKSRPNWSPSTLPEISQSQIISTFFDPTSPYVSNAPRLQTPRTSVQISLSHYALPTESEIRALVMSDNGGENALTREEVVERLEVNKSGKKGVRAKVGEVIDRQCETFQGEYLRWKTWQ